MLIISSLLGLLVLANGCSDNQRNTETKPDKANNESKMIGQSKEIVAQNVLAVQLAKHNEIESRTIFAPTEPIYASVYLTDSQYIESRRIFAFLVQDKITIEEQRIEVGANEKQNEFDFCFSKTPRPSGAYQIKFVEIARSNGKPVLLARLFLNVE